MLLRRLLSLASRAVTHRLGLLLGRPAGDVVLRDAGPVPDPAAFAGSREPSDRPTAELAAVLAAAEGLDGVWVEPDGETPPPETAADLGRLPWCTDSVLRPDSWRPAGDGSFEPRGRVLVKLLPRTGPDRISRSAATWNRFRRGAYLSSHPLPARLEIGIHDVSALSLPSSGAETDSRPAVLVLAPFLARGGAEHTLFETMRCLRDRFRFDVATLAPHVPERGDRRDDFRPLVSRLWPLGDVVHPAAMPGMLVALLRASGARILYNANGTTLFYDFAPRLQQAVPGLVIVDHLYDHRIGYVDRYEGGLPPGVDACIAENHRIAELLTRERGVDPERVPVVWPCGRADDDLPSDPDRVRQRVRAELGIGADEVVFLAAARLHPQKRPLDFVALASRFTGEAGVRFLWAGGGDSEAEFRAAMAEHPDAPLAWLGMREDVPELIAAADVGCLVSEFEGLPVFLLECLQLGRPFLGTDVGDLGRVLRETGAGPVVDEPGDLDAIEAAVRGLLDPAARASAREKARAAGARFSPATCADRYAEALLAASPREEKSSGRPGASGA